MKDGNIGAVTNECRFDTKARLPTFGIPRFCTNVEIQNPFNTTKIVFNIEIRAM
jgi:hypothetical protein